MSRSAVIDFERMLFHLFFLGELNTTPHFPPKKDLCEPDSEVIWLLGEASWEAQQ